MKILKRFLLVLLVLIVLVLIMAVFLPSRLHIEESAVMKASPELIFKHVNDLRAWEAWSPFQKEDPDMVSEYEGPAAGVGAVQKWKSKVHGDGSMTIIESTPFSLIKFELAFEEQGTSYTDLKFEKQDHGTKVTWAMDVEELDYPIGRIFGLFMPGMMRESFSKGLDDLKRICEEQYEREKVYSTGNITIQIREPWQALVIKDSSTCDKVGEVIAGIYGELGKYCGENRLECIGPPFSKYYIWNDTLNKFVMEAGFPVKLKAPVSGRIYSVDYPAMKVATAIHTGTYETSYFTYQAIENYLKENNLKLTGAPWEVYISDPEKEKDASKLQTQIFYPVQ